MQHLTLPLQRQNALKLFLDGKELNPQRRIDHRQLKEMFRLKACSTHLEPQDANSVFEEHRYLKLREAYTTLDQWITQKGPIACHMPVTPSPLHCSKGVLHMHMKPKSKWRLGLPNRTLKTGEYLFYSGQISCGDLIEAVDWQKNQHQRAGQFAVAMGYIEEDECETVLKGQQQNEAFYSAAIRLGLLSTTQRNWLLFKQRRQKKPIGEYFVQNDLISTQDLSRALVEKHSHNQQAA
jgi:hypothetical protein